MPDEMLRVAILSHDESRLAEPYLACVARHRLVMTAVLDEQYPVEPPQHAGRCEPALWLAPQSAAVAHAVAVRGQRFVVAVHRDDPDPDHDLLRPLVAGRPELPYLFAVFAEPVAVGVAVRFHDADDQLVGSIERLGLLAHAHDHDHDHELGDPDPQLVCGPRQLSCGNCHSVGFCQAGS